MSYSTSVATCVKVSTPYCREMSRLDCPLSSVESAVRRCPWPQSKRAMSPQREQSDAPNATLKLDDDQFVFVCIFLHICIFVYLYICMFVCGVYIFYDLLKEYLCIVCIFVRCFGCT